MRIIVIAIASASLAACAPQMTVVSAPDGMTETEIQKASAICEAESMRILPGTPSAQVSIQTNPASYAQGFNNARAARNAQSRVIYDPVLYRGCMAGRGILVEYRRHY